MNIYTMIKSEIIELIL